LVGVVETKQPQVEAHEEGQKTGKEHPPYQLHWVDLLAVLAQVHDDVVHGEEEHVEHLFAWHGEVELTEVLKCVNAALAPVRSCLLVQQLDRVQEVRGEEVHKQVLESYQVITNQEDDQEHAHDELSARQVEQGFSGVLNQPEQRVKLRWLSNIDVPLVILLSIV
jgi:hypothetical protein